MKPIQKTMIRLLVILPMLVLTINAFAQSDPTGQSAATRTYAITNATIMQSPGSILEEATIIITDGLISAVGKDVSIPGNAEVIDGTDMYVYPGFIDGMSYTAADRPEQMERPDDLFTPDPPNDYAGITPAESVISQIDLEERSIDGMREVGFAISHSVPYGRMLPGSGALLLLNKAENADDMILSENVSMYTQFVGAPGAYPGNTLGIMAKWRNLFRNATYTKEHAEMYAGNPTGLERPTRNRVMEAFYPIVDKTKPVFYNATSALEARRAMRLQKELDFSLVLGNLEQSWDLAEDIKQSGTKLFMSLELPDEPKNGKEEETSDEVKQLEERRMAFYKKHVSQYAELEKAGITFGFSTMGLNSREVKDNLVTIIENGLSEDDVLAALTSDAAELLGIDTITGTIESGKLGNIIVANGPYFDKESKVKFVFVDGDKFEYDIKETPKGTKAEATGEGANDIVGTWNYTFSTPQGEQGGQMIISKEDGYYTGTMTSDSGQPDNDMENISYIDGALDFEFSIDAGGQLITVVVNGTVTGPEYEAEASISAFNVSFPLTATKNEPNKN